MAASVVIVSNRLPISVKKVDGKLEFIPSPGGLATGLSSYVNDKRNKWIGWPGLASDGLTRAERETIADEFLKHNCYPVFLSQKQLDDYYNGYSNSILWPIFHDLPVKTDLEQYHEAYWKAYRSVNAAFADVVLALSDNSSQIWVHDYQLLALPAMLRAAMPKAKIGFFLHIPFPGVKHFRQIPSAKQLLYGILGADLVGLHTERYARNFLKVCAELTREAVMPGQVLQGTHLTRVTDFPMGIDYERFQKARQLDAVKAEVAKHRQKYKGLKVILTVDRLDPTKGLVERLEAYQEFLRRNPDVWERVILVMLAQPSRTEIEEYKRLRIQVERLVNSIQKEFSTSTWRPIDYIYTSIPVESVTALYQVADVAFITPLRDGMNLVAKEYIASRPKLDGVLILSSTAGAAQELTDALLVNPRRPETLVDALTDALSMNRRELKQRVRRMQEHIATHTVQEWAGTFMKTLQKPLPGTSLRTRELGEHFQNVLVAAYQEARRPVILLDYDGVLSRHVPDPAKAGPSLEILRLLKKIGRTKRASVAIISGRKKDDLQKWLGNLPISLVAEHGALIRPDGAKRWKKLANASSDWQERVLPILERYAARTPGAFVEKKNFSLVWHYRAASPYYAQKHLVILRRLLRPYARSHDLGIYGGDKILEIKPVDINKGAAARELLTYYENENGPSDFILCIGDDYTDEDMFETLGESAYTIKVGRGLTAARYRLRSVAEVESFLQKIVT